MPDPVRCCEQLEGLPYRLFLDSAARGTQARPLFVSHRRPGVQSCAAKGLEPSASIPRPGPRASSPATPSMRSGSCSRRTPPTRCPGCRHSREARRASWPTTGVACSSACRRRVTTTSRCRTWCSASTTGCWRGTTRRRERGSSPPGCRRRRRRLDPSGPRRAPPPCASGCSRQAGSSPQPPVRQPAAPSLQPPAASPQSAPSYPVEGGWWDPRIELRSSFTHAAYLEAVARVREYIFAGDIFQANLSQRFEAPLGEPAWALYCRLRAQNAAPFAAFLDFPGAAVVSASPERFLHVDVAGTSRRARSRGPARAASAPSTTGRSGRRSPRAPRIGRRT